jgi:cytidylate kinase
MSLYIEWINRIKEKADEEWLTDSQREIYEKILSRWQAHPFVNLYGPSGSGRTFIARLLAKKHGYVYTHDIEEAPRDATQVIVDDAQYSRTMRLDARAKGLRRVLLITSRPVREAMPKAELQLDEKDIRQFQAVLANHCEIVFTETIPQGVDLAEIIRKEVIERGEANVN